MSDNSQTPDSPKPRGNISAGLSLLLSVAALCVSGWLWYALYYKNTDLYRDSIPDSVKELRSELTRLKQQAEAADKEIGALNESHKALAEVTRKALIQAGRDRSKWVLAEVEQLLIIANQRMQLSRDLETALLALEAADNRLRGLADPSLLPIRKQLAGEISTLKSMERTDISGLALRLSSLIDSVEQLPLSLEVSYIKPADQKAPDDKSAAKTGAAKGTPATDAPAAVGAKPVTKEKVNPIVEFWRDLTDFFRIRNDYESYKPLLPPEQQYFLRENLRLLLLGAQQALLRNEQHTYQGNLRSARHWVGEYFDTHSQAIRHLDSELDALLQTRLILKTPDISGSLKSLRKLNEGSQS